MNEKLNNLRELIQRQQIERLIKDGFNPQNHIHTTEVSIKPGKKYTKIDIGTSGAYMIDNEGNIFGIKAYGVIQKGHYYGTLDTINDYNWGGYKARKGV